MKYDSENVNTLESHHDRLVTGESEKQELYERLRSSPFIKKHELETPEDLSPRLQDSDPDIAEEEKEKRLRLEIMRLKDKLEEFNKKGKEISEIVEKTASNKSYSRNYNSKGSKTSRGI